MKEIGRIKGNVYILNLLTVILALVCWLLLSRVFHIEFRISHELKEKMGLFFAITIVIYVLAILFVHELLHMLAACFFVPRKDVSLKFGVMTWQCRIEEPIMRNQWILVALLPCIILSVLGIVGIIVFHTLGFTDAKLFSVILFLLGFAGAAGDLFFITKSLKFPGSSYIIDKGIELKVLAEDV